MIKARNQEKSTPEVQKKQSGKSKPLVSVIGKGNKNAISVDITAKDVNGSKKSPANKVKKQSNTKKKKEEVV